MARGKSNQKNIYLTHRLEIEAQADVVGIGIPFGSYIAVILDKPKVISDVKRKMAIEISNRAYNYSNAERISVQNQSVSGFFIVIFLAIAKRIIHL